MKQRQRRAEHEQRARPQQHGECRNVFAVVRRGAARRPVIDRAGIMASVAATDNEAIIDSTAKTAARPKKYPVKPANAAATTLPK